MGYLKTIAVLLGALLVATTEATSVKSRMNAGVEPGQWGGYCKDDGTCNAGYGCRKAATDPTKDICRYKKDGACYSDTECVSKSCAGKPLGVGGKAGKCT